MSRPDASIPAILVVCEAPADAEMATILVDRVVREEGPEWIADNLEALRTWRGFEEASTHSRWRDLKSLYSGAGLPRMLGRDPDMPRGFDGAAARKAILLARSLPSQVPTALLLVRDLDGQPQRRHSLEAAARRAAQDGFTVLLATPDPEREAWLLHGFEPETDEERERLDQHRGELGFDPRIEPNRLRGDSRKDRESRDIKAVLWSLVGSDSERERRCSTEPSLAVLRRRGKKTHLTAFLDQVETELLPNLGT